MCSISLCPPIVGSKTSGFFVKSSNTSFHSMIPTWIKSKKKSKMFEFPSNIKNVYQSANIFISVDISLLLTHRVFIHSSFFFLTQSCPLSVRPPTSLSLSVSVCLYVCLFVCLSLSMFSLIFGVASFARIISVTNQASI